MSVVFVEPSRRNILNAWKLDAQGIPKSTLTFVWFQGHRYIHTYIYIYIHTYGKGRFRLVRRLRGGPRMLVLPDSFEKRKRNVSRSIRMKTKKKKKRNRKARGEREGG